MANPNKRIAIVVSNTDRFEASGYRTGLWLGELVEFWNEGERAGIDMEIVSPKGGYVPIDPVSLLVPGLSESLLIPTSVSKWHKDAASMDRLESTAALSDVNADRYDAIYLTGGHGTMFDFRRSTELVELIARLYEDGKIVSAVCHGPSRLLDVTLSDGTPLLQGKKVTGFSWKEEILARRNKVAPFNLQKELTKRGADYSKASVPFMCNVVEDGRLITGQNPMSAKGVGAAVVAQLNGVES